MAFEPGKIPEGAKPFPKGKSGNPKGRPKKGVSATLSAMAAAGHEEVTAEQVRSTMLSMLDIPRKGLLAMATKEDTPILDALIARSLSGKKGWEVLQDLLDRTHGKAKHSVDHTTGGDKMVIPIIQVLPRSE